MQYITYETPWCNGTIVCGDTDKKFPIGYDVQSGETSYSSTLEEVEGLEIIYITDDIEVAVSFDSAHLKRIPFDKDEYTFYNQLWDDVYNMIN